MVSGEAGDRGQAQLAEGKAERAKGSGGEAAGFEVIGEGRKGVLELEVLGLLLAGFDADSRGLGEQPGNDVVDAGMVLLDPALPARQSALVAPALSVLGAGPDGRRASTPGAAVEILVRRQGRGRTRAGQGVGVTLNPVDLELGFGPVLGDSGLTDLVHGVGLDEASRRSRYS